MASKRSKKPDDNPAESRDNRPYPERVAERIIKQLEEGTAPWVRPWAPGTLQRPFNPTTNKPYKGGNALWLMSQDRSDPRWMTYKQAEATGAQVRKSERGTYIQFVKYDDRVPKMDAQGKPVTGADGQPVMQTVQLERPKVFGAIVFNGTQIDGLPELAPRTTMTPHERHAAAEEVMAAAGVPIEHGAQSGAWYNPVADRITLPERERFHSPDGYYATALHELGHATGHPTRLNRDLAHPFGSEGYAREELRAELASLMMGEKLEIGHDPGQHAAYIGSWIKVLKEDPRELFRAAADAEKIVDFLTERQQRQDQSATAEVQHVINVRADWTARVNNAFEAYDQASKNLAQDPNAPEHRAATESARGEWKQAGSEPPHSALIDNLTPAAAALWTDLSDREVLIYDANFAVHEAQVAAELHAAGRFDELHQGDDTRGPATAAEANALLAQAQESRTAHVMEAAQWVGDRGLVLRDGVLFDAVRDAVRQPAPSVVVSTGVDRFVAADAIAAQSEIAVATARDRARAEWPDPDAAEKAAGLADNAIAQLQTGHFNKAVETLETAAAIELRASTNSSFFGEARNALDDAWRTWQKESGYGQVVTPALARDFENIPRDLSQLGRNAALDPISRGTPDLDQEQPMTNRADARTQLVVPYREKDQAKAAGARWDKEQKTWYAPEGSDLAKLATWLPENRKVYEQPTLDPRQEFIDALKAAGLRLDVATKDGADHPYMDGKRYRVPVEGADKNDRSGMYIAFTDGHPAGHIQNFVTGYKENWKSSSKAPTLSDTDRERLNSESAEKLRQREAAETATHARTAGAVVELVTLATMNRDTVPESEYARVKGITGVLQVPAPETAAQLPPDSIVRIAKDRSQAAAMRSKEPDALVFVAGDVLVPANDKAGNITTVQSIGPDGRKSMASGGKLEGSYHIEVRPAGADKPIFIGEGYATMKTIGEAAGVTTVTAYNAGNLPAVAAAIRELHPERPIVIAGDNDHHKPREIDPATGQPKKNVGREKAEEAAKQVNAYAAMPAFDASSKGTDWNDYRKENGDGALRKSLLESMVLADRRALQDAKLTGHDAERVEETISMHQAQADRTNDPKLRQQRGALENLRGKAIEEVDKHDTSDELPPREEARELSHTQSQKRAIKRGR